MQALTLDTLFGQLLIPISMVAQIASRSEHKDIERSLSFVNSSISWREYNIPLVSSSEMLGAERGADDNYDRAVILWPIQGAENQDLFALTSLESPKIINISNQIKSNEQQGRELITDDTARQFILDFPDIDGHVCFIPDLSLISKLIFKR